MTADDLAKQAADRVREIIGEAERRAEEILSEARAEAARIRAGSEPAQAPKVDSATPEPGGSEPEGARLVALKMALDGKQRDEVARHLADEYGVADSQALLDDVYARARR